MDTKERILLNALRLFARDGYEAVSVSSIAAECRAGGGVRRAGGDEGRNGGKI